MNGYQTEPPRMTGWHLYVLIVLAIGALIAWGGLTDLGLWLGGEQTISAWLRMHPWAFWLPAVLMLLFIGGMVLHLFFFP